MNIIILFIVGLAHYKKVLGSYNINGQLLITMGLLMPVSSHLELYQEIENYWWDFAYDEELSSYDLEAYNDMLVGVKTRNSDENDLMDRQENCDDKMKLLEDDYVKLRRYHNQCILQTGASPRLIKKIMHGVWEISDVSLKKWTLCVMIKLGLMSPEGVYRLDVAWTRITEKDKMAAEKLIDRCLKSTRDKAEPHDYAWEYLKCHHHNDPLGDLTGLSIFK